MPTPTTYLPYNNRSSMDANADGKLDPLFSFQTRVQLSHRRDNAETCPHCPLDIVFMGLRIAKVAEDPIVTILGNVPSKPLRHLGTAPMVGLHHRMEVFGIELSCEAGGIHKRTTQDRDLPELAAFGGRGTATETASGSLGGVTGSTGGGSSSGAILPLGSGATGVDGSCGSPAARGSAVGGLGRVVTAATKR